MRTWMFVLLYIVWHVVGVIIEKIHLRRCKFGGLRTWRCGKKRRRKTMSHDDIFQSLDSVFL